ncbi:MAG: PAS domain-containing sensor histidine kinase [Rhizobacter sp.]|nr:PAS domain-containing sensor histidine kinase [Bacteriovorax sp.]
MKNQFSGLSETDRSKEIINGLNESAIVSIANCEGKITFVNEKFVNISGYSREELIGSDYRIVNSGVHVKKDMFKNMWRTIASGQRWEGDICNRKKDGSLYWVHTSIVSSIDSQGKTQYVSIRFDITKQKIIESELEEKEQLLSTVLQNLPVAVFAKDIKKDFKWNIWNKKAEEIFGISAVDCIGKEDSDFFSSSEAARFRAKDIEVCNSLNEIEKYEDSTHTLNGFVTLYTRKMVIKDSNGEPRLILGITEDITELKKREIQDVLNSKLIGMGIMSAGIAHEINNPLTIISGSLHLLQKNIGNPEKVLKIAEALKKSTDRMSKIVNGLKRYSRSNSAGEYGHYNLSEIVREALILTEIKAKTECMEITFKCDLDSKIFCDEIEIEQVLINLINNSIDANKNSAEKWVRVEMTEEHSYCVLKVIDSGPGIPEKIKNVIFDPFFTTKEVGQGTGLGLSITKSILEKHDAKFSFANDGGNTCFEIRFKKAEVLNVA